MAQSVPPPADSMFELRSEVLRSLTEIQRAVTRARSPEDMGAVLGVLRTLPDVVQGRSAAVPTTELLRAAAERCAKIVRR